MARGSESTQDETRWNSLTQQDDCIWPPTLTHPHTHTHTTHTHSHTNTHLCTRTRNTHTHTPLPWYMCTRSRKLPSDAPGNMLSSSRIQRSPRLSVLRSTDIPLLCREGEGESRGRRREGGDERVRRDGRERVGGGGGREREGEEVKEKVVRMSRHTYPNVFIDGVDYGQRALGRF